MAFLVTLVITVKSWAAAVLTDAVLIKKIISVYYFSEPKFIIHLPALEGFR